MLRIDWENLVLLEDDRKFLSVVTGKVTHINEAGKGLVCYLISEGDWERRKDLIRAFQPNEEYKKGERIFFSDGKIGKIQKVENGYNAVQGSFRIIYVSFGSTTVELASAVERVALLDYRDCRNLSEDELQEEVDEVFDKYGGSIRQAILKGIESGDLDIVRFENQLLSKGSLRRISQEKLLHLKEHLRGCVKEGKIIPKSVEELLDYVFEDETSGEEKALRMFSLNCALRQNEDFHYLGAGRWMLSEEVPRISVQKRPSVPKIRSKMAEQMGIDDTIDYDKIQYDENELSVLEEAGEIYEIQDELIDWETWRLIRDSQRERRFPPLTFQQRYKGFLPLTAKIRRIIPPHEGKFPMTLFYGALSDEESFQAIVDFDDNTIKTLDDSLYRFFFSQNIQAGNYIYIEHLNSDTEYRIYTKKLDTPKLVKCRFAAIENGKVVYEDIEHPMLYESAEHRFISEIRLEDLDALWKEAEDLGLSIFDCMCDIFPRLANSDPEGKGRVHYYDLFNAVFFKRRQCTLGAVLAQLSARPCFYQEEADKGSGYWRFDEVRGVQPAKLKRKTRAKAKPRQKKRSLPSASTPEQRIIHIELKPEASQHLVYPIPFLQDEIGLHLRKDMQQLLGLGATTMLFPVQDDLFVSATPTSPESLDRRLVQFYPDKSENRFVTPREVADLMVNLAQPASGETVIDICCGTGILLVKAFNLVRHQGSDEADLKLFGVDKEASGAEATRISLAANAAKDFKVVCGDSLSDDLELLNDEYDLILGNPPFRGNIEVRFLRRWAQLVREGGRMVVNTADGVLANTSTRNIRDWLVEHFNIRAVISLPRPRDSETYGAKSNILVLQDDQSSKDQPTLLAEITDYKQIPDIIRRLLEMDTSQKINLGETIVVSEKEPMVVLKNQEDLRERMEPSFWAPEFIEAEDTVKTYGCVTLGELLEPNGNLAVSDHMRKGRGEILGLPPICDVQYFTVAGLMPTGYDTSQILFCNDVLYERLKRTRVEKGDILIADSGVSGIGRLCFVHFTSSERSCTGHLFVLRVRTMDPRSLTLFLRTRFGQLQIHRSKHGVASPYLKSEDLEAILVPCFSPKLQSEIAAEHEVIEKHHDLAMQAKGKGDNMSYRNNIETAEKILNDLVQQLEEIIGGKRKKIIPVHV